MIGLFAALLKSIEYTLFIIFTTTWNASHAFGATCYKADLWWNHGEICQVLFTRNFSYFACSSKDSSRCMVPSQERLLGCSSRYALVKDIDNLSFKQCFLQWRAWHQQNSPPQQRSSHVLKRYRGGWISPANTNFCLSAKIHRWFSQWLYHSSWIAQSIFCGSKSLNLQAMKYGSKTSRCSMKLWRAQMNYKDQRRCGVLQTYSWMQIGEKYDWRTHSWLKS